MNTLELISLAKYYTRTPQLTESDLATETDAALTMDFWAKVMWQAWDFIHTKVVKSFQDYFLHSTTFSYSAGTNEYDVPGNLVQLRMIERVGSSYNDTLHPISLNKKNSYISLESDPTTINYPQFFYMTRNKIGIVDADAAGTVQIFYIRRLPKPLYGTITVPTSTTIVLPASPTLGLLDDRDDYYNGATIRIVSCTGGTPTGAGQRLPITDYVASTRTLTVSAPSIAITGTTIVAEIVCEIPEEHNNCVAILMAMFAELSDSKAIPADLKDMFQVHLDNLINGIVPLQAVESDHVHSPYKDE